ncbi:TetR/AcrR family transcriptional regulator [Leifsonia sp. ku-ls]|nr:TetR/AcrR family transcriptional regulator [Leifsonia sp. ku-ls]
MADPLTRTRQARRDDLIAATIRVINRDGLQAASLERIAAEAGTSKGTALYHFTSKEQLYSSVVDALFDSGRAYMTERVLAATATPRHQVEAYVESNLRFILDNVEHVVATQRIVQQQTGTVQIDDAIAPLRSLLEAGQQNGSFGDFDADFMAHSIRAVIDAAAYYLPEHPGLDGDHFIAEGVGLVLRAIDATDRPEARTR